MLGLSESELLLANILKERLPMHHVNNNFNITDAHFIWHPMCDSSLDVFSKPCVASLRDDVTYLGASFLLSAHIAQDINSY